MDKKAMKQQSNSDAHQQRMGLRRSDQRMYQRGPRTKQELTSLGTDDHGVFSFSTLADKLMKKGTRVKLLHEAHMLNRELAAMQQKVVNTTSCKKTKVNAERLKLIEATDKKATTTENCDGPRLHLGDSSSQKYIRCAPLWTALDLIASRSGCLSHSLTHSATQQLTQFIHGMLSLPTHSLILSLLAYSAHLCSLTH
jgi:hypothetical protein